MKTRDPVLHTYVEDCLPDDHPLAWTTVSCDDCGTTLHAINNECMDLWVETGKGNFCLHCFTKRYDDNVNTDDYGLPSR